MTNFIKGQRVRSTRTEERRLADLNDLLAGIEFMSSLGFEPPQDRVDADIANNKNSPIVGDTGTVVDPDSDGWVLVEWDREIGPLSGERETKHQWFARPEEVELIEEKAAA